MWRCIFLLLYASVFPLFAQAWDFRLDYAFPHGQQVDRRLDQVAQPISSDLDPGSGGLLSVNHRIIRINPILKFEGGLELTYLKASGRFFAETVTHPATLKQCGMGLGLNAQFWVPFTGLAGETGLIQRFQRYTVQTAGSASHEENLSRLWWRVGLRYQIARPFVKPYFAISYQMPFAKSSPTALQITSDLPTFLRAQGTGFEFDRLWTFGVGLQL